MKSINNLFVAITSICLMLCVNTVHAQGIMTTLVGDSLIGYSGDGGPAYLAELNQPYGVCLDDTGNLYITDIGNFCIRKVNASTNIITTIAGGITTGNYGDGGLATLADIAEPYGVCTDNAGNIYFTDYASHVVRKIRASTGIITTIAGNYSLVAGYSGDGGLAINAILSNPTGICIDASGNLYIADAGNNCIRKINTVTGIISTIAGNGIYGYSGNGGPATTAQLSFPDAVAVDAAGNLYIADEYNYYIREVNAATGIITNVAGNGTYGFAGDSGLAVNATIGEIDGICVDSHGDIYIADISCSCRKINKSTGIINTVVGSGTMSGYNGDGGSSVLELLNLPAGLCVDPSSGNIIIADQGNNRIRKATQPDYHLSVSNIAASKFSIYPNPSRGMFTLQTGKIFNDEIAEIYNATGVVVKTISLHGRKNEIDLTDLPQGNYLINFNAPGSIPIQKVTIVK